MSQARQCGGVRIIQKIRERLLFSQTPFMDELKYLFISRQSHNFGAIAGAGGFLYIFGQYLTEKNHK